MSKFNITCIGKSLPVCIFIIPFETIILVTIYHGFIRNFRPVILAGGRISEIIKKKKNYVKNCYMIPSKYTGKTTVTH
jgi:hypothetical protein